MLDSAAVEPAEAPPADASPSPLPEATVEPPKKRGGRPRGSLNRATKDIRIAAQKYTKRALIVIAKLAEQAEDPNVRLKAACELLDRAHGKPSQTTLIGGDGGDPIKAQRVADLMDDPEETARRVALLLYAGDPNYRAAADAERDARNRGGRQDNFAESFNGARAPAGESDGSAGTDTPDGETASQQTPERAEESTEPEELTPPKPGYKLVWLGIGAIAASEPSRPSLPHQYRLLDCRGTVAKHGPFADLVRHLERRHDSALPTPHLETVDDPMVSPLWFSQPDQRPPQVFHGHENKKHR